MGRWEDGKMGGWEDGGWEDGRNRNRDKRMRGLGVAPEFPNFILFYAKSSHRPKPSNCISSILYVFKTPKVYTQKRKKKKGRTDENSRKKTRYKSLPGMLQQLARGPFHVITEVTRNATT